MHPKIQTNFWSASHRLGLSFFWIQRWRNTVFFQPARSLSGTCLDCMEAHGNIPRAHSSGQSGRIFDLSDPGVTI